MVGLPEVGPLVLIMFSSIWSRDQDANKRMIVPDPNARPSGQPRDGAKSLRLGRGRPADARLHDEEWGVPQRDPRMLWQMLMLEGFQAGLAWIIVLRKREAFRKAFAGLTRKRSLDSARRTSNV